MASPEEVKELAAFTMNEMKVDAMLENNALGIPVYIEIDGSQHEKDREYRGMSQSHLDRIKDFCSRLNQGALMIRVKSDTGASAKVERIYEELKRYDKTLREYGSGERDRRERLQMYADALCYGASSGEWPLEGEYPLAYARRLAERIAEKAVGGGRFGSEQVKLLNTWIRRREDLDGFIKAFKSLEGEKNLHVHRTYSGAYYSPYRFMDCIHREIWRHRRPAQPDFSG